MNSLCNKNIYQVACLAATLALLMRLGTVAAQKSCFTPSGSYGQCVPFKQCSFITQQLTRYGNNPPQAFIDNVRASRCYGTTEEVHLCCDVNHLESANRPTTSSTVAPTRAPVTASTVSPENYEASLNANGVALLSAYKCGSTSDNRVAFGEVTNLAEFPWMALLRYNSPEQPFRCGGSLITNRYVLTAAHCIVGIFDLSLIGVRLGEHNISSEMDCQKKGPKIFCSPPVEDFGIEKQLPHEEYSNANKVNDVALIKLDRTVEFKSHIRPICLPITLKSTEVPENQQYFIAGWGITELNSTSAVLLKAKVTHRDNQVCQNIFKRARITANHICAGGDGRIDSCKGDSGGPLFFLAPYQQSIQRFVQFGIVSFGGEFCGVNKTYPGIYANVVQLMPWITSNLD